MSLESSQAVPKIISAIKLRHAAYLEQSIGGLGLLTVTAGPAICAIHVTEAQK